MAKGKDEIQKHINIKNKKASFEYAFIDTYTAGIVLTGTEIKSIRLNNANINDSYAYVAENEVFVTGMHISRYTEGTWTNHDPLRVRKLLLNKKEIKKISSKLQEVGTTLVPFRLFLSEKGLAKLEFAVAKGKKLYDKREDLKEKDAKRDIDRHMKQ
ncbi:MAG: SsrA-binding protein SmpB [Bacteroidota bacterium]|jgi:SsrA-binding protein